MVGGGFGRMDAAPGGNGSHPIRSDDPELNSIGLANTAPPALSGADPGLDRRAPADLRRDARAPREREYYRSQRYYLDLAAYDFLQDGSVVHHFRGSRGGSNSNVAFECSLAPGTVRLVLGHTKRNVHEAYKASRFDVDNRLVERRGCITCAQCQAGDYRYRGRDYYTDPYDSEFRGRETRVDRSYSRPRSHSRPTRRSRSISRRDAPPRSRPDSIDLYHTRLRSRSHPSTREQARSRPRYRSNSSQGHATYDSRSRSRSIAPRDRVSRSHFERRASRRRNESRSRPRRSYRNYSSSTSSPTDQEWSSRSSSSRSTDPSQSRAREESWKRYRGACGLDSREILKLCDANHNLSVVRVGINSILRMGKLNSKNAGFLLAASLGSETHNLILNGRWIRFNTIPNMLRSTWYAQDAVEIEVAVTQTARITNNFGNFLKDRIESQESAMRLYNGSTDIGARLLILDILTALMDCWYEFLTHVRQEGAWQPRSVGGLGDIKNKMTLLADREYLKDFAKATNDLNSTAKTIIETIELLSVADHEWDRRFRYFGLKARLDQERLSEEMSIIENDANEVNKNVERLAGERQAASIRRLTLVASIFLPLTTACSLLSMNNRVRDLGPLWWDWLGIVAVIAFIVVLGYRSTAGWHELNKNAQFTWIRRLFRIQYSDAKVKIFTRKDPGKNRLRLVASMFIDFATMSFTGSRFVGAIISGVRAALSKRRKANSERKVTSKRKEQARNSKLVPLWPRVLLGVTPYLLWLGALASFITGMFTEVRIGALALGYSAAGAAGFFLTGILLWRLVQLTWSICRLADDKISKDGGTSDDGPKKEPDVESGSSHVGGKELHLSQSKPSIGGRWLGLAFWIPFFATGTIVLSWVSLLYVLLAFLFGFALLDVLLATLTRSIFVLIAFASEKDIIINSQKEESKKSRNRSRSRSGTRSTRYSTDEYSTDESFISRRERPRDEEGNVKAPDPPPEGSDSSKHTADEKSEAAPVSPSASLTTHGHPSNIERSQ